MTTTLTEASPFSSPFWNFALTSDLIGILGKGKIIKNGKMKIAVLAYGTILDEVLLANDILLENNIDITIANGIFAKPFDQELVMKLACVTNCTAG